MTEETYQETRLIMKKANIWRSRKIRAEREYRKWDEKVKEYQKENNVLKMESAKANAILSNTQFIRAHQEFTSLQLPC